jgi:protein phosphatase
MLVREPLFAVADGMGGHRGGNVASAMTVETLERMPVPVPAGAAESVDAVRRAILEANRSVLERGESDRDLQGMGTTVTALLVSGKAAEILHVGDSRAYLVRDGDIQQLTEDHTVAQDWVRRGRFTAEEADRLPQRSILTRALGVDDDVEVDHLSVDLHDRDRFLLCSDGLSNMLSDDSIREVVATVPTAQEAADRLVSAANEAGGDDNITVVVIDVKGEAGKEAAGAEAVDEAHTTAEIQAVDRSAAPGSETAVAAQATEPARKRRRRPRTAVLVVLLLCLFGVAILGGFIGVRSYLNNQWYVGTSGTNVAIFRGIPATLLGVHLSRVERMTRLPADQAARFASGLRDGIHADSRADAERIVESLQRTMCGSQSSTCILGPAG